MGVALMAVDMERRITRFNGPAEALTGHKASSVIGKSCADVLRASLCQTVCPIKTALKTPISCCYGTVVLQTRNTHPITVEVTASTLVDANGQAIGAVGLFRDLAKAPEQHRILGSRIFVSRVGSMQKIFEALPQLSNSMAPLLILGEAGCGRHTLGETIHRLAASDQPRSLFKIKCGNPRGEKKLVQIWPPKHKPYPDTLLLIDLCLASPSFQQQLLGLIEDDQKELRMRLISTASRQLEMVLESGAFRHDLYYRLNVLQIVVPTLEERKEDIPLLINQWIDEMNVIRNRNVLGFSTEAIRSLLKYQFLGNIHELLAIVDSAHRRCKGQLIEIHDLPQQIVSMEAQKKACGKETVLKTLKKTEGNITKAAKLLGVHRSTLWRMIRRFGIKL